MSFVQHQSNIRTIRHDDDDFMLTDGFVQYPRAMLHILPGCPSHVRDMINWALAEGYLKPVAHLRDNELMWDRLSS